MAFLDISAINECFLNLMKTSKKPARNLKKPHPKIIFGAFSVYLIQIPGQVPGVFPVNLPVNSRFFSRLQPGLLGGCPSELACF